MRELKRDPVLRRCSHSYPRVRLRHTWRVDHRIRLVSQALLALKAQAGRHRGREPGGAGTVLGQMVLRQILLHGPAYVMPEPRMLISNAYQRFDENGDLTDEETRQRLRRFLEALREWSASLARAGLLELANAERPAR